MKTSAIYIALVFVSIASSSCTKEHLNITGPAEKVYTFIDQNTQDDCTESTCNAAIATTRETYQALADSICDTIWVAATCCQDGEKASLLTFVAPNPLICNPKLRQSAEQ